MKDNYNELTRGKKDVRRTDINYISVYVRGSNWSHNNCIFRRDKRKLEMEDKKMKVNKEELDERLDEACEENEGLMEVIEELDKEGFELTISYLDERMDCNGWIEDNYYNYRNNAIDLVIKFIQDDDNSIEVDDYYEELVEFEDEYL